MEVKIDYKNIETTVKVPDGEPCSCPEHGTQQLLFIFGKHICSECFKKMIQYQIYDLEKTVHEHKRWR